MQLIKHFVLSLFGFLLVINISEAQTCITLKDAIDTTLKNNLQIKVSELNEYDQLENLLQAKYSKLPNLNVTYQGSSNWGRTLDVSTYSYTNQQVFLSNSSLNTQLILFQGGQIRNQIIENKILLDVDKSQVKKMKNDLILSVATAYLQILASQDMVQAALNQKKVAETNLKSITRLFELGKKTLADIAQGRSQITTADLNLANAQSQLDVSSLILKQYMELQPSTQLVLEKPNIYNYVHLTKDIDIEQFYKAALDVNPDALVATQQLKASAIAVRIAKGAYSPTIAIFGSLNSNFSNARQRTTGIQNVGIDTIGLINGTKIPVIGSKLQYKYANYPYFSQYADNLNRSIGINLQIPVFNHFNVRSLVRKAQNSYSKAKLNETVVKDNLFKVLNQAVLDLKIANMNYNASEANLKALREAYSIIQRRYDLSLAHLTLILPI